jgi:hypothetical protein
VGLTFPNAAMTPQQSVRASEISQRAKADLAEWIIVGTCFKQALHAPQKMYRGQDFPTCHLWGDLEAPGRDTGKRDMQQFKQRQKLTCMRTP